MIFSQGVQHVPVPSHGIHRSENIAKSPIQYGDILIDDEPVRINSQGKSQTGTVLAGTIRAVEGKHSGLHLFDAHSVFRACEVCTESLQVVN